MVALGQPTPASVASFYAASLLGLRAVEAKKPTGRRFGADADARWRSFQGHLDTGDRIDLLLRDAAAAWPTAFAATRVFGMRAVSEDDPFGPSWEGLAQVHAEDLWRSPAPSASRPSEWLRECAKAWDFSLKSATAPAVDAHTRFLVVGPSAVAALADVFFGQSELDWSQQVTVVASLPGHRHLAGLAASVLNAPPKGTAVFAADETLPAGLDRLVTSPDAHAPDLCWAQAHMAK